jgi:hypothetical protein
VQFQLDDYKRRTTRLEWSDLDLASAFAADPLDEATLRCLRYMHDVEYHTVCYLRDLLLTAAHADPEITAFLSFWAYEEFWHGEALADVLAAHGEPSGARRVGPMRQRLGFRSTLGPLLTAATSALVGADFIAVHMTWGAVNEWTTQAGYAQLSRRAGHTLLSELLGRIMRQEGRHIDFYASQAESRLERSRRARRLTRMALGRFWHPVGAGVMPEAETQFLVQHLFGDEQGREAAARLDRRIDRLPGLRDLGLAQGAVAHATAPASPGVRTLLGSRQAVAEPGGNLRVAA